MKNIDRNALETRRDFPFVTAAIRAVRVAALLLRVETMLAATCGFAGVPASAYGPHEPPALIHLSRFRQSCRGSLALEQIR